MNHSFTFFPLIMDPILIEMKNMPENPEDGEFFLPSFIVLEINSRVVLKHEKNSKLCNADAVAGCHRVKPQQTNSSDKVLAIVPPTNHAYVFLLLSSNQNQNIWQVCFFSY